MNKFSHPILNMLNGKLVVSCQPVEKGPMDHPEIIKSMALAAEAGGAGGLRIEGITSLKAIRHLTKLPIIGIIKRNLNEYNIRITPLIEDVENLSNCGADVIAYEATNLPRPFSTQLLINKIKEKKILAMADCANLEDGKKALSEGADILGTTLSGYAYQQVQSINSPDLTLVKQFRVLKTFTMAEGRYHSPELAKNAIKAGANSVTVGSAITRIEHMTNWFKEAIESSGR